MCNVESNVAFSLIPAEKVVQTPLPKYYKRACRNNMGKQTRGIAEPPKNCSDPQ